MNNYVDKMPSSFPQYYNDFYIYYVNYTDFRKEAKKLFLSKEVYVPGIKTSIRNAGDTIENFRNLLSLAIENEHNDFFKYLLKTVFSYPKDKLDKLNPLWCVAAKNNNVVACKLMNKIIPYELQNDSEVKVQFGLKAAYENGSTQAFVWILQNYGSKFEQRYPYGKISEINDINFFVNFDEKKLELLKFCYNNQFLSKEQIKPELLFVNFKNLQTSQTDIDNPQKDELYSKTVEFFLPTMNNLDDLCNLGNLKSLAYLKPEVLLQVVKHPDFERVWGSEPNKGSAYVSINIELEKFIVTHLENQKLKKEMTQKSLKNKIL